MAFKTTDLCDEYENDPALKMAEPLFSDYGGITAFCGEIVTVSVLDDNVLVRSILETEGNQRVLVVDGKGSTQCALMGDMVAQIACDNKWSGVVINGCIRDSVDISRIAVGVKALHIVPKRSRKEGKGERDIPLEFAGITFHPGSFLYADEDGILVSDRNLEASP